MRSPAKESVKPLKDRTIKDLAGDAFAHGKRLQIGIEPLDAMPMVGRGQVGGGLANTLTAPPINGTADRPRHSVIHIAQIIASLQSLSETLPAVLAVANGWAPCGNSFQNRDDLISATDMLKAYRDQRAIENAERDAKEARDRITRERELVQTIFDNGVKTGIEQEQARAKEARKGRKRGAKKS